MSPLDTIAMVLTDCQFVFNEIVEHTPKKKHIRSSSQKHSIRVALNTFLTLEIYCTFSPNIFHVFLKFEDEEKTTLHDARCIASDISRMKCTIEIPKLHVSADDPVHPEKIEWYCHIDDKYQLCVLITILSNFPRNLSENEIL